MARIVCLIDRTSLVARDRDVPVTVVPPVAQHEIKPIRSGVNGESLGIGIAVSRLTVQRAPRSCCRWFCNDMDDPSHGPGTPQTRRAARNDFNALDPIWHQSPIDPAPKAIIERYAV